MNRLTKKLVLAPLLLSGCASWFLNGAKMADRDYAAGQAGGFKIQACTNLVDHSTMAAPDSTYYLVQDEGKRGLFERSPDGTGALIQNHWVATDGDHYFAWVQSSGWEFIIPQSGQPTRLVYTGVTTGSGPGGATKPTSKPVATCAMVPLGGA